MSNTDFVDINKVMDATYGKALVDVAKADAPMAYGSDTGMFNALYGRMAFSQFNNQAITWAVLPKKGWTKSGWRIRTARGITLGGFGVADAGTVPDTVKSTIVEVTASLKQVPTTFEMGNISYNLGGDDVYPFDEEMKNHGADHMRLLNSQLHRDVDTLAGTGFESLDRVASSNAEATDVTIGLDANDADIYGLDRDATTDYDAYVDHNSGTDRNITIDILRTALETIEENSGIRPNVIITGFDQRQNILNLMESQVRYLDTVTVGVNGINSANGYKMGARIATFDDVPIIADAQVVKDTGSRVYALNTEHVFLGIRRPTSVIMSTSEEDMLTRGTLTRKGMYLTMGELICTNFSTVGKIRDLN